jgi:hypothetical protein
MAQAFSVSWFHMEPLDAQLLKDLKQQFLGLRYSEELGYGFRGVLLENSYLSAVLVKRTATFIPQLDVAKGELVDREIFLFSETRFALDSKFGLVEVFGSSRDVPKVLFVLRPFFGTQFTLSPVTLAPAEVIPILVGAGAEVAVDKLTVSNFQYREGIIGRYEMRLTVPALAMDIIQKYATDVSKSTISVSEPRSGRFMMNMGPGGRLTVRCHEDEINEILGFLKVALLGGKE